MCGFTGFWLDKPNWSQQEMQHVLEKMMRPIAARGPDSEGVWCHEQLGLAIGHRRLSIVDLSPAGNQPMISPSKRFVLAYNGEIYNAGELRKELEKKGIAFVGTSDTEVMLKAIEQWGLKQSLSLFHGMFALSLWDRKERCLQLVRDRMGIKPLYWGIVKGTVFFGSQLNSFFPHPFWKPTINFEALPLYFRYNYIPTPFSVFQNIYKLTPGAILTIDSQRQVRQESYWEMVSLYKNAKIERPLTEKALIDQLEEELCVTVRQQMIADVPIGSFLSGGIDSSLVTALMQKQSAKPVQTFSIGFEEKGYNEADKAKEIAHHLQTEHHEYYLGPQEVLENLDSIIRVYDEPFADSSQIPTYFVSALASKSVKVILSGDGGDECFAGYNRYLFLGGLWKKIGWIPYPFRHLLGKVCTCLPSHYWDHCTAWLPSQYCPPQIGDKIHKLGRLLKERNVLTFYDQLLSCWNEKELLLHCGNSASPFLESMKNKAELPLMEAMQLIDSTMYLPDDILTKVDRASMAHSLEVRVPLLDHRIVSFAFGLPSAMKIRSRQGKWLLRQVLYRHVPQALLDRPKMGFGIPLDKWLRTGLKEWADNLLSRCALQKTGLLDCDTVRKYWEEHQTGRRNWAYALWGIVVFQSWIKHYSEEQLVG